MHDRRKVLIVDDNYDMKALITEGIKEEFDADYVPDGFSAQKLLLAKNYSLILCDIHMPFMNGFTLVEELKNKAIKTPIIFISGEITHETSLKAFHLGVHNILQKPFKLKTLREKIKAAIIETQIEDDKPQLGEQQIAYLYDRLKSHYYDYEEIIYHIKNKGISMEAVLKEIEKKERLGKCLLDDDESRESLPSTPTAS